MFDTESMLFMRRLFRRKLAAPTELQHRQTSTQKPQRKAFPIVSVSSFYLSFLIFDSDSCGKRIHCFNCTQTPLGINWIRVFSPEQMWKSNGRSKWKQPLWQCTSICHHSCLDSSDSVPIFQVLAATDLVAFICVFVCTFLLDIAIHILWMCDCYFVFVCVCLYECVQFRTLSLPDGVKLASAPQSRD